MRRHQISKLFTALLPCIALLGCDKPVTDAGQQAAEALAVAESPAEFVAGVNKALEEIYREEAAANWIRATYITEDSALIAAKAQARSLAYHSDAVKRSTRFAGHPMDEDTARSILLLKLAHVMPAPDDAEKRTELTTIATRMEGMYGEGKYCPGGPDTCQTLNDLEQIMADRQHDYDAQLDAWLGWHTISPPMREDYQRFVELANEGARELGFSNLGEMWRSGYDMTPAELEQETDRLWGQVKPLYDQLHCYVRDRLASHYGEEKTSRTGLLPAHLLGNMWAQQWGGIYDLVEPYPGVSDLDIDSSLAARLEQMTRQRAAADGDPAELARQAKGELVRDMVRMAEDFYTSLGMPDLPETFWERSLLLKPRDREVVCHASAWSLDGKEDVRIKQCLEPTGEELYTAFHELGHVYYDLMYNHLPPLLQGGAHDGFHEAIGDTINLSMTPDYLVKQGLVKASERSQEATINEQMKQALDKIAFLPFGRLIDQWRWGVFDGRIPPERYNQSWWELRAKYQGIAPPVERTEADFDPGAKYHIPGNTPYTRYFLAFILQFQFHKALCDAAGWQGPLHECSIYGNAEAGKRFMAMLSLGASRPWQDALEQLTGTRGMDAGAISEYFSPLMAWLQEQNNGRECGWNPG